MGLFVLCYNKKYCSKARLSKRTLQNPDSINFSELSAVTLNSYDGRNDMTTGMIALFFVSVVFIMLMSAGIGSALGHLLVKYLL